MAKKKAKVLKYAAIALALSLSLPLSALAAEGAPHNVLLSWTGDAATTMTVSWRDGSGESDVLQVVAQSEYDRTGFETAVELAAVCHDISLDGSGAWHYEVTATGLASATTYVYRVGNADGWSAVHSFTTDDSAADTLTFAYMGDVQPANDSAEEFALWGELAQSMIEYAPELSFAVLGGDIVNSGISMEQFDLFASNAEAVFSSVPLFATPGNHESNFIGGKPELYLDYFAFPANGPEGFEEEIYSFDAANCHIISLNSWIYSGEQPLTDADYERVSDWLKADLAASTADWQIVVTHVPVYAVHSDTTTTKLKANWAPIFEEYGVDLVFVGHQHVYSRSYPMYQGRVDYENGVTYIMGVSGSKFYDSADETLAERTVYNTATYQLVRVDGDTLSVQTLDTDGNELDYVTVMQREGTKTRLAYLNALWEAAGCPEPTVDSPFSDTEDAAVIWGYETGLVIGCPGGVFRPDEIMTGWQIDLIQSRIK